MLYTMLFKLIVIRSELLNLDVNSTFTLITTNRNIIPITLYIIFSIFFSSPLIINFMNKLYYIFYNFQYVD